MNKKTNTATENTIADRALTVSQELKEIIKQRIMKNIAKADETVNSSAESY